MYLFKEKRSMAFNVNDYIKPASKPFANRIVDPIISQAITGRPNSVKSVASHAASTMLTNVGVSEGAISAISSSTTSDVVSEVSDAFYTMANLNPARASRESLLTSRFGKLSTADYMSNSDPATRISAAQKDQTIEIIAVV